MVHIFKTKLLLCDETAGASTPALGCNRNVCLENSQRLNYIREQNLLIINSNNIMNVNDYHTYYYKKFNIKYASA